MTANNIVLKILQKLYFVKLWQKRYANDKEYFEKNIKTCFIFVKFVQMDRCLSDGTRLAQQIDWNKDQ